jgi:hypothetical protein
MRQRRWGRVINIASTHGLVASVEKAAYVAAKHGIVGLTKAVALECANTGITCNAICPGWVLTPLAQQQVEARAKAAGQSVEEATIELLEEKQPMLSFTTPEHLGCPRRLLVQRCGGNHDRPSIADGRRLARAISGRPPGLQACLNEMRGYSRPRPGVLPRRAGNLRTLMDCTLKEPSLADGSDSRLPLGLRLRLRDVATRVLIGSSGRDVSCRATMPVAEKSAGKPKWQTPNSRNSPP